MSDENIDAHRQFLDTTFPAAQSPKALVTPPESTAAQNGSFLYDNMQITRDGIDVGIRLTFAFYLVAYLAISMCLIISITGF